MMLAALIMGIAGSLHCAGMCSPLAMMVTNSSTSVISNRIFYNLGRITTYGILGAISASVGYLFPISKFQNALSIALGLMLIIMAANGITGLKIPFITNGLLKLTVLLKKVFSKYLHHKKPSSIFLLGSVNGLLPCGLTFLALSYCVTLPTPIEGFSYMFIFGAGTLPVMLGFVSIVTWINDKMNWNIKHLITGLMVLSGVILIVRVFIHPGSAGNNHGFNVVDIVVCGRP